jgi:(1->4)-alpha-D-glucan 1-alpha-D-glucosylmutase
MAALHRLARLVDAEPALRAWVEERLAEHTGTAGDPASWDRLDALLWRQHYRLAFWRVSGEEINYRRFFDINELAAIRQENPAVFEATHSLVSRLVKDGLVDGVRVDHVDGLYDPGAYLAALGEACPGVPIWVEKILGPGEELPPWPVAGTTGYEFLAAVGCLFMDPASESRMTEIYREFAGQDEPFEDVAARARLEVAESSFAGEVGVLASRLHRLAQHDRRYRDVTLSAFRDALEAMLASFPVYRTYLAGDEPRDVDREIVIGAAEAARSLEPGVPPSAVEFLTRVLLLDSDRLTEEERARWTRFRRQFQQMSSPIMAKGVEDTSFFRYNRLLALNEVGAHPDEYCRAEADFHAWAGARQKDWAGALSATSTHDTKRSEDARMRLSVLSEMPEAWRRDVRAWARLNARHKTAGRPDANTEYYLYQSLLATYDGTHGQEYAERIAGHIVKAAREAKTHTSWATPDLAYEQALERFTAAVLDPVKSRRFLARLAAWVERIEPGATLNGLALVALKCLAPGVPDIYQGTEAASLALTDPDNRRPVDFAGLAVGLACAQRREQPPPPHEAKQWLTWRLLKLRQDTHPLFAAGGYEPLEVAGEDAGRLIAFARTHEGRAVAAVIPRLGSAHIDEGGRPAIASETTLRLPGGFAWRDALTGERIAEEHTDLAAAVRRFPVVVLEGQRQ